MLMFLSYVKQYQLHALLKFEGLEKYRLTAKLYSLRFDFAKDSGLIFRMAWQ